MKITQTELRSMAKFYRKKLFYGLPEIDVFLTGEAAGVFILEKPDSYMEKDDSLIDEYLYRPRYKYYGNGVGAYLNEAYSWEDPENNPVKRIEIKKEYSRDIRKLTACLLHELAHYYLWYCGYEYGDENSDFLKLCKKMGLPTNYDFKWDKSENKWVHTYDYSQIDKYIEMYKEGMAA